MAAIVGKKRKKISFAIGKHFPTMQLIIISNGATGVGYLKAFLCGSCLFTGAGGQFMPSRSSSQLSPLLAVLALAKSCRATPAVCLS